MINYNIVRNFVTYLFSDGKPWKTQEKPGNAWLISILNLKDPEKRKTMVSQTS